MRRRGKKFRPPMKGDLFIQVPKKTLNNLPLSLNSDVHRCKVCDAPNACVSEDDGRTWMCGDHWALSPHYQSLNFLKIYGALNRNDTE